MSEHTDMIIAKIMTERKRQDERWGEQNHNNLKWLAILAEEFGEAATEVNELNPTLGKADPTRNFLEAEVRQIAAVAIAWLESMERNKS